MRSLVDNVSALSPPVEIQDKELLSWMGKCMVCLRVVYSVKDSKKQQQPK